MTTREPDPDSWQDLFDDCAAFPGPRPNLGTQPRQVAAALTVPSPRSPISIDIPLALARRAAAWEDYGC